MFQSLSRSVEELTELYFYLVNTVYEKQIPRALVQITRRPCLHQTSDSVSILSSRQSGQVVCTSEVNVFEE